MVLYGRKILLGGYAVSIALLALKEIGIIISEGFKSLPANLNKNISNMHL